jgi:predicted metal-dependent phosphoesterase TrpH
VCANYRRDGFDFLAITDHGRYYPSLEAIEAYKNIPTGLKIFRGEEVHPPGNHIHIVNFGGSFSVNELFASSNELIEEIEDAERTLPDLGEGVDRHEYASCKLCYDKIRQGGGLAIYAHPHWENDVYHVADTMTLRQFKDNLFDAFEVLGGHEQKYNNLQTAIYNQARAEGCRIPIVGSSDSHGTVNANWYKWTSTIVMANANEVADIRDAVLDLRSAAVETYPGEHYRVYGEYRMVKLAMFLLGDYFPVHDMLCFEEGRLMKEAVLGNKRAIELLEEVSGRTAEYLTRCYNG